MRPSWTARPRSFCRSNALLCRRGTQGGSMLGQSLRYTAAVLGASIAVALSLLLVHAFGLQGSELLLSLAAVTWVALHTGPAAPRRSPPPCWAGSGPRSSSSAARRGARRWRSCSTERSPPDRAPRRQGPGLARPTLTSNRGPEERFLSWGRRGDRSDGGPAAIRAWRPRGGLFADSAYAHGVVYANGSEWDFANPPVKGTLVAFTGDASTELW